jgi:glutamine transport system substrate-binding protein
LKFIVRKSCILLLTLSLVFVLSACGNGDTLQIGTDNSFKPFAYLDEDGNVAGFDIDLWDAIAKEAGFQYEMKPMDFSGIINSVKAGTLDAGIAGITIRDDRKEKVDFAMPYYNAGLMLLVRSDTNDINGVGDLEGKTIATKISTTSYDFAQDVDGVKEVKPFQDINQAYQELLNGGADAVIFDAPNVVNFVDEKGEGKVKTVTFIENGEQYGIAVQKGSELRDKINEALEKVVENGTYEALYEKWFGQKPKVLPGQ